jgi:hypothetical protein
MSMLKLQERSNGRMPTFLAASKLSARTVEDL